MASTKEKLAESLKLLQELHDKGIVAIRWNDLPRTDRGRLVKNGFLKKVTKGWYMAVPPDESPGDSTSWFASFWHFLAGYLKDYGEAYVISPDQSLQFHVGNRTVPSQLIIRTPKKSNYDTPLPFGTSIWHWETPIPKNAKVITIEGIQMMDLPSSLIYCTPAVFTDHPTDVRTALATIKDASELLGQLLEGGHSTIAGRLIGAFRNIGRDKIAEDILKTMESADYKIEVTDPFETKVPSVLSLRETSPYVNRIRLLWDDMRKVVIENFPKAPGIHPDHEAYMKQIEDMYVTDAYHSLSIERYRVTPELIEKVKSGSWDIRNNADDIRQRDAMAASGYARASQKVRESIKKILEGNNAGKLAWHEHGDWYLELFASSVAAGILRPADLAGYRNDQVYISNSKHVPLNKEAVRDAMPILFELLENEPEASVRAVLGHFIFVFIHPYMDGNGRMGRFLLNVMLASGGYPWTVIPVEERNTYMQALEQGSVHYNIKPFTEFMAYLVGEGLKGRAVAKIVY